MHFVPFPGLTEVERIAGLGALDFARVAVSPREAQQRVHGTDKLGDTGRKNRLD